jgi:hypothetical protein
MTNNLPIRWFIGSKFVLAIELKTALLTREISTQTITRLSPGFRYVEFCFTNYILIWAISVAISYLKIANEIFTIKSIIDMYNVYYINCLLWQTWLNASHRCLRSHLRAHVDLFLELNLLRSTIVHNNAIQRAAPSFPPKNDILFVVSPAKTCVYSSKFLASCIHKLEFKL